MVSWSHQYNKLHTGLDGETGIPVGRNQHRPQKRALRGQIQARNLTVAVWPQNRLHRSPTSWFFLWFSNDFGVNVIRHQNDLIQQSMTSHTTSGVASPTIWSCYANISVFIDRENNRFLKKWIMIMIWYLHSMTKLSGWLHHCLMHKIHVLSILLEAALDLCHVLADQTYRTIVSHIRVRATVS
jgi:hypothetical protein